MAKVVHIRGGVIGYYIGRPTLFGNPFAIGKDGTREEVIAKFREYFIRRIHTDAEFKAAVWGLRGQNLACWCAPKPCHGDVILEYLEGKDVPPK